MFDHYANKIILSRLRSDGAKGKGGESAQAMDATLCGVDIYCKEYKRIKSVCQCNNYGGVGVTKGVAAGLSDVNKQYDGLYYVAACVFMRHHSC